MATHTQRGMTTYAMTGLIAVLAVAAIPLASRTVDMVSTTEGYRYVLPSSASVHRVTLPDGRILEVHGAQMRAYLLDGSSRQLVKLPEVRAFGSETVMPNGMVLFWGGVGETGTVLQTGQWFNPQTGRFVPAHIPNLPPRAGHTFTVLPDGNVLIAGGWSRQGTPAVQAELWDPQSSEVTSAGVPSDAPRIDAQAFLTADGRVRIDGGVGVKGEPLSQDWVFEPRQREDVLARNVNPFVASVGSAIHAQNTPLKGPLTLLFTGSINVRDLSHGALTLLGPKGVVKTNVVPMDDGRLLFVQLPDDLYPGSHYTLFLKGAHTASGQAVPFTAVDFQTPWVRAQTVAVAGEGNRRAATGPSAETSDVRPLYLMAGSSTKSCAGNDPAALCRAHSFVREGAFYPGDDNRPSATGGHWRLYGAHLSIPNTAAREARLPKGTIALIGQVRQIDETPVANVDISVGGVRGRTDQDGVFILAGVPAGRQEVFVNGESANYESVRYGRFPVGVNIRKMGVTKMPYVMYLPRILSRDEVALPSPSPRELVLTHPDMPGLEVHIPAGAVFKDREGHVLTHIALVPTPVDRAPFPLPDNFPMYFTIQPGDAVVEGLNPLAARGIRVVYPNYGHAKPNVAGHFWVYDVKQDWKMYGGGHVSDDAKQVIPDPGVTLTWAVGAGYAISNANPPTPNKPSNKCSGDPVDEQTGIFFHEWRDFSINDLMPLILTRTYNSADTASHMFGVGGNSNFGIHIYSSNQFNNPTLVLPCGQAIVFTNLSSTPTPPTDEEIAIHVSTPTPFYGATLQYVWNPPSEYLLITTKNGTQYSFSAETDQLTSVTDRFGNQLELSYNGGLLEQVLSPSGRTITLNYDSNNRVTSATDNTGRNITYAYNASGSLATVTYPDKTTENYTYDSNNHMLTRQDRRGNVVMTNQYDANSRVAKQTYADNTFFQYAYTLNSSNVVTATTITDPNGHQEYVTFDPVSSYPATDTTGYGSSLAQTTTYSRQASGLINQVTDPLGRVTVFNYDQMGNVTQMTRLAGTSGAVTTQYTYDPIYSGLTSVTDPLGHTTNLSYTNGCLTQITDPLGNTTSIQCNAAGQPGTVKDALGHSTTFAYNGYDLQSITDALGRQTSYAVDSLGRRVAVLDALGNSSSMQYDTNDRVTQMINNLGLTTTIGYDGNGNPTSVTLPSQAIISATYDARNRKLTRTDALKQNESWTYDGLSQVLTHTDRKGQLTQYSYDAINRRSEVTYADHSTIQSNYDAGDRLTSLVDSASGTMSWGYDGLDRLTSVTTAQGNVSYTYDASDRRTSMTAASQAVINYTYDNANRLTMLAQGSETVQFAYDALNRGTTLTLPNGVSVKYGYDNANELTSIAYAQSGGTNLGNLAYAYDNDGRRTGKTGSLATDAAPTVTTQSGSFDLNNRQTSFDGEAMSYDADGNLTGDGTNTYAWNARNQLTQITSGGATQMSYTYDALGRRISKAAQGGTPTQFLYDGANAVQETVGSTVNPILIGPGVDERYARNDVTGRTYFLTDALNSTIALTSSTGAIQNQYSYDPYGNVTASNATFTNPYQYTGREADSPGLYYYRARYYSPMMGGFISEDPTWFAGGQNSFYAYVGGDPLDRIDPLGLWSVTITAIDGIGGAFEFGKDNQTGQWFWGGRIGLGVEDGISFDPFGKRPGRDDTPCHGTTMGTYVEAGVTAGIWTWNPIQGAAGVDEETGDDYHEGPVPADTATANPSPKYGFDFGGSIGVEVVHH